ncbi:MAG: DivIVA domain-containing protein [Halanaerobiales bacterium]
MKISPLDIYNHEFNKTTFGYNIKQVDEFLDDVGVAYEKLLKEVNSLQDENEKLKEKIAAQEDVEKKLENIVLTVQETAKEMTRQANKEADIIIRKAEIKAEKIEKEAKEKLHKEYKAMEAIKESRDLFKIRFKTMLEGYLEMLKRDEKERESSEKDIAAYRLDIEDNERSSD